MLRKEAATFIVSQGPEFAIGHGWGTKDVIVQAFDADTGESVGVDFNVVDDGNVKINVGMSGSLRALRVVIIG